jgi:hypothetical protein
MMHPDVDVENQPQSNLEKDFVSRTMKPSHLSKNDEDDMMLMISISDSAVTFFTNMPHVNFEWKKELV